jgi:hypothetical protein
MTVDRSTVRAATPKPGTIIPYWSDIAPYTGECIVVATSRHKATIDPFQAMAMIKSRKVERVRWWASLASQADDLPAETEHPCYCTEGQGRGWIEVLVPIDGAP